MSVEVDDSLAGVPTERLEAEACTLAAGLAAAACRFLLLVGELDRREAWKEWECRSMAHWLSWKCGVGMRSAHDQVRVARKLESLPAITSAFVAGTISYSKVRALVRVATPESDADLVDLARCGTAAHVERVVAGYERVRRLCDTEVAAAQLAARGIWVETLADGTLELRVRLMPDAAVTVVAEIDRRVKETGAPATGDERDPWSARRADALVEIVTSGTERSAATTVEAMCDIVVHADLDTLSDGQPGRSESADGVGFARQTLERLACDCRVQLALDRDGQTLDIGRRSRKIPTALRRALLERDGGECRWPGCGSRFGVQVHHLVYWTQGGPTDRSNLVSLCWRHHRSVHERGWHLSGDPDHELLFIGPDGRSVAESATPVSTDPDAIVRSQRDLGLGIDEHTIHPTWAGEILDLDLAIIAIRSRNGLPMIYNEPFADGVLDDPASGEELEAS
jgi:HNH endonuclease.